MTALIDITPGRPAPPPDPRVARRRWFFALMAAAAVTSVAAGGVGYVVLAGPPKRPAVVLPSVSAPVVPSVPDPRPGVPAADPVKKAPRASPDRSPSRRATVAGST